MSYIDGEVLVFDQHAGPSIQLRVHGDEFYARYETLGGHTVLYDVDRGYYCYARTVDGAFVSSGVSAGESPPPDIPRHLRESARVRNQKFELRYAQLRPPEVVDDTGPALTFGPNGGLLSGRRVGTSGAIRGLTLLVEFDDIHTEVTAADVERMLNDMDYDLHGNFCSVRRYFHLMSSGQLDYTNDVIGPIRLSGRRSHYINNLLINEALNIAVRDHGIDLSAYDSRNEGIVDALSVLYAGRTQYSGNLWPHNHVTSFQQGSVRTHFYTIQSVGRRATDLSIGTFVHESGHMLCRWPDLYDYGTRDGDSESSSGLGRYCLMSSGNHLDGGKTPSPTCAYLRDLAGWCQEVSLNTQGQVTASHGDYGTCLRFDTHRSNEYFLVENRSRIGLDSYLPDSGLAVYHCDTLGSNELQAGTTAEHYQCALLQADGRRDLEHNNNSGDAGDLYPAQDGVVLDGTTVPSSRSWQGTDSGLVISRVTGPDHDIHFQVGRAADTRAFVEARPDLFIPDAPNNEGVRSVLNVATSGMLRGIRVAVEITHTYRGDLSVTLTAPSGAQAVLHTQRQDAMDNLHLNLSDADHPALAELRNEAIAGDWTLHVVDTWADDVGRLDYWSLALDYEPTVQPVRVENQNAVAIPDDDPAGIRSTIDVPGGGALQSISVEVSIVHTYRGDLRLELERADGSRVLLKGQDSDRNDNLNAVYDMGNTDALDAFKGGESGGTWTLHVSDRAYWDKGTLKRWAITIER
jgi:M6 family metalloprotease-like protein